MHLILGRVREAEGGGGGEGEEEKMNGQGRSKFRQGRNSWQWAHNYAWLYSALFQTLKGEHLSALGSQKRGP